MPSTPVFNLPYPAPDETPNGPEDIQALALAFETALANLVPNSGVLTNLAVTPGAGWSTLVNEHHVIGKKMWLHLQMQRTGANVVTGSNPGNIEGDPLVATITNAARRPTMDCFGAFRGSVTSGSVQLTAALGEIKIADMHTNSVIATSDTVQVYFAYAIP